MAYDVLIHEHSKDVWVENEDIKKKYTTKDQRKNDPEQKCPSIMQRREPSYHFMQMNGRMNEDSTSRLSVDNFSY